jgi:hypothetical protein
MDKTTIEKFDLTYSEDALLTISDRTELYYELRGQGTISYNPE